MPAADLPADPTTDDIGDSRLLDTFHARGVEAIIDLGAGGVAVSSTALDGAFDALPADLRDRVAAGELAYAWTTVAGTPSLVVGGRVGGSGPAFYFVHDTTELEAALAQFRLALVAGALILILVALVAARWIARGVLAPVEAASRAAERIERGDLSARVPVTSDDEFGTWARAVQPDGRGPGRHDRPARGRRGAEPPLRGRRRARAADTARGARRRGVDRARAPRRPAAREPSRRRAARRGRRPAADARRRSHGAVAVRCPRRADRAGAGGPRPAGALGDGEAPAGGDRRPARRPPVMVDTDPRRLERILGNLLDNAREHAPGSPVEVTLVVEPTGSSSCRSRTAARASPPDRLAHLFERFYKADPSRHGGSSGLGLAIAAEHATLLGGTLSATDRPGGGLRVELRLPVTGSLPAGDETAMGDSDAGTPESPQRRTQTMTRLPIHPPLIARSSSPSRPAPGRPAASAPSRARCPTPTASVDATSPDLTPPRAADQPVAAPTTEPSGGATAEPGASATPSAPTTTTMIVRAYFVLGGEPGSVGLVPVLRIVPKTVAVGTRRDERPARRVPTRTSRGSGTITTAIPAGTRLLGLTIKNGVATVDLSTEFDSGGGSASMQYRLAQVVYTLTQFSTVRSVVFQIEGQTVTVFGSEGIVLDGPVGRADYTDQLPAIFVDRPGLWRGPVEPGRRQRQRERLRGDVPGRDPRRVGRLDRRPAGHGDVRHRLPRAPSTCHAARTRSPRRSGGPCGSTTSRPRTGRRRTTRDYPVWLTPGELRLVGEQGTAPARCGGRSVSRADRRVSTARRRAAARGRRRGGRRRAARSARRRTTCRTFPGRSCHRPSCRPRSSTGGSR